MSKIPPVPIAPILKADSGATQHYIRAQDAHILINIRTVNGPSVYLPDMEQMTPNQQCCLPIKALTSTATQAHVLLALKSASRLSLGQLCDDNCSILLNKYSLHVLKNLQKTLSRIHKKQNG